MDTLPTPPRHRVTAIAGDGIGPEVMRATQQVLRDLRGGFMQSEFGNGRFAHFRIE